MRFLASVFLRAPILLAVLALASPVSASELLVAPSVRDSRVTDRRLQAALAPYRGQPVVINFWASWCAPCRDEMPALQRFANRWGGHGLTVITIAVADNANRARDFLWEIDVDLAVLDDADQTLGRSVGARALPTTLVLDHRHRVRLRAQGVVDWDAPSVEMAIKTLFKQSRRAL